MDNNIIVGLDIGTTKVCAVVAENRSNELEIIGLGSHPSVGLRKGEVINIEETVASIKKAVEEAGIMAGCNISAVYTGIAGGHIKSFDSCGIIPLKNKEVTRKDIENVLETAKTVPIPMDQEIIHTITQDFILDGHGGINAPLGMSGVRLEANVHIVTGSVVSAQNIIKCVNDAGLDVCDIVLESLASSEAVLSDEDRQLGTAMIDFGGGTTDMIVFSNGAINHSSVLALGGDNLTYDIAVGLKTPIPEAEKIKIEYGCGLSSMITKDETIEVSGIGGHKSRVLPRRILGDILEPRVEEIFSIIYKDILIAKCENLIKSGVIITGGSAELPGIVEVAEQVFNTPVSIGYPKGISGLSDIVNKPMYSTAVGLVIYGIKQNKKNGFRIKDKNIFYHIMSTMKGWFREVV